MKSLPSIRSYIWWVLWTVSCPQRQARIEASLRKIYTLESTKNFMRLPLFPVKLKMFNQVKCKFIYFGSSSLSLSLSLVSVFLNNFCGLAYGSIFYDSWNLRFVALAQRTEEEFVLINFRKPGGCWLTWAIAVSWSLWIDWEDLSFRREQKYFVKFIPEQNYFAKFRQIYSAHR